MSMVVCRQHPLLVAVRYTAFSAYVSLHSYLALTLYNSTLALTFLWLFPLTLALEYANVYGLAEQCLFWKQLHDLWQESWLLVFLFEFLTNHDNLLSHSQVLDFGCVFSVHLSAFSSPSLKLQVY